MQVEVGLRRKGGTPTAEVLSAEIVDGSTDVIRMYFGPITVDVSVEEALLFGKEVAECGLEARTLKAKLFPESKPKSKTPTS